MNSLRSPFPLCFSFPLSLPFFPVGTKASELVGVFRCIRVNQAMESTPPYPLQLPFCSGNISSSSSSSSSDSHGRCSLSCKGYCSTNSIVFSIKNKRSDLKSPLQLQLPLRRPRRRHPTPPPTSKPPVKKTQNVAAASTSDILRLMDGLGLSVPIDIYTSLIKECAETRDADGAVELHAHVKRSGLRFTLPFLNRILMMYASCGLIDNARQIFDKMPIRDFNSWAVLIAGYMDGDLYQEAISLFVKMRCDHKLQRGYDKLIDFPVSWIIVCLVKACVETMNLGLGEQLHGWLLKVGYDVDLYISSSLINMYGRLGHLEGVDIVFDHMAYRNTLVWTAKLVNKCREEHFYEVLNAFKDMGREGVEKNGFTFSSVLRACARMNDNGQCGQQVHAELIKLGLESNDFVQCGLVDMYGKCGLLKDAERAFEMIGDEKTAACWNAMLTGYVKHGHCIKAIKVLYAMKSAGLQPQESLLNEVRFACGNKALHRCHSDLI